MVKLDELYTEKQLIYNSPISDICKAKPVNSGAAAVVCLKIVDVDFKIPPHSIHREIEAIKKLQSHRAIVEYIDHFQIIDDMILVEQYYDMNLSQLMTHVAKYSRKKTRLNLENPLLAPSYTIWNNIASDDVRGFLTSMSDGLRHIHGHGIIHRDIKPSNILFKKKLTSNGGGGDDDDDDDVDITQPVIADFGVCYDTTNPPSDEPPLGKYIDVCTGIYKSPELLLGMTDYQYEIDVWALGVILTILYSPDFKSVLLRGGCGQQEKGGEEDEDEDGDEEMRNEMQISDLHLLSCIFNSFGTPHYEPDDDEEMVWQELERDEYHFKKFNLKKHKRKAVGELIPRCHDEQVQLLFSKMTRYDRGKRITSEELFNSLKR
ncbi:uncharacterized protein LODBEIA_P43630 [Lodderomyces beijingensis]|uniref:Protein kinase domain-containing protein n=1 Tax=Lodderomyces beijingensis TaxID=1775926 RepID=A0ABP0ZPS1_9ASCO